MSFDVRNPQQENKEGITLQPNQLEYIGIVLSCFYKSTKEVKDAVKGIQHSAENGYDSISGGEENKWYTIQNFQTPSGEDKSRKKLTIGIADTKEIKNTENHVVDAKHDIKSGKTIIGVNRNVTMKSIVEDSIEEYKKSGYKVIEGKWVHDIEGRREKEYSVNDPKNTKLRDYIDGGYEHVIYEQPGETVRFLLGDTDGSATYDSRKVRENGKLVNITEKNNRIGKEYSSGELIYSVEKKAAKEEGSVLKLNIVIPPDDEKLAKYIEEIRKIESTKYYK